MNILQKVLLLPALVLGFSMPASAQSTVGVFNDQQVRAQSTVGLHIITRLNEIGAEIQAEMTVMGQPYQQAAEQLSAETAAMTPEAIQARPDLMQRMQVLNQQAQQLERARQIRLQEYQATERQAMVPVMEALSPILEEVIESRGIIVLFERSSLMWASADIDITLDVVAILNQRLTTVPVNRVRLPQNAGGAPAQQ